MNTKYYILHNVHIILLITQSLVHLKYRGIECVKVYNSVFGPIRKQLQFVHTYMKIEPSSIYHFVTYGVLSAIADKKYTYKGEYQGN